ncbi:hypothetical protein D9M72_482500 [compost metagenome]
MGSSPVGKMPPLSEIRLSPTSCPSTGVPKMTKYVPMMRNAPRAATLMRANQNSSSPKTFTETRLRQRTTTSAIRAQVHCGTAPIHGTYLPKKFI